MDFWISDWISGFLDFWISGFQFGFLQTVYEISFVTDPSRNTKKPRDTTPFSAHCEVMSQRKRRSQQRLEAFIETKKVQKLQDSFCKVSDAGTPAGCDGGHGAKLSSDLVPNDSEAAPTIACFVDIQQSSTPQDIFCEVKDAGTLAGNDDSGVKTDPLCATGLASYQSCCPTVAPL